MMGRSCAAAASIVAAIAATIDAAAAHDLPIMSSTPELVEAGALMTYGPSYEVLYRRASWYLKQVLEGADPSELPVEQPSRFDLIVNQRAAKALDVDLAPSILSQASRILD